MNNNDIEIKKQIIKDVFGDGRNLNPLPYNENTNANLFIAENGEIVYFTLQLEDFNERELARYSRIAEDFYEIHHEKISIYILCPDNINVSMKQCDIKSEADFKIKLARIEENPSHFILNIIKEKVKNNEELDSEDLAILSMLPVKCKKEDRDYFREEYFKIINKI